MGSSAHSITIVCDIVKPVSFKALGSCKKYSPCIKLCTYASPMKLYCPLLNLGRRTHGILDPRRNHISSPTRADLVARHRLFRSLVRTSRPPNEPTACRLRRSKNKFASSITLRRKSDDLSDFEPSEQKDFCNDLQYSLPMLSPLSAEVAFVTSSYCANHFLATVSCRQGSGPCDKERRERC